MSKDSLKFILDRSKQYIASGRAYGIASLVISSVFSFLPFIIFPINAQLDKVFAATSFSAFAVRIISPVVSSFYLSLFKEDDSDKSLGTVLIISIFSGIVVSIISFFSLGLIFKSVLSTDDGSYLYFALISGPLTFSGITEAYLYNVALKKNLLINFYKVEAFTFLVFFILGFFLKASLSPAAYPLFSFSRSLIAFIILSFSMKQLFSSSNLTFFYLKPFYNKSKVQLGLNTIIKVDVLFERFLAALVGEGYISILAALRQITSGVSVFISRHLVDLNMTKMFADESPRHYFLQSHLRLQRECLFYFISGTTILFFVLNYFQHSKLSVYHLFGFYLSFGVVVAGAIGAMLNNVFYISNDNLTPVKTGIESFTLSLIYRSILTYYFSFWGLCFSGTLYYYYGYLKSLNKLRRLENKTNGTLL